MEDKTGYEAGSEASPSSSSTSELSLTERKKPCRICGRIMTCFLCRETREHIYCATAMLRAVPPMWLCEACRSSNRVVTTTNRVVANEDSIDQTATSPRTTYQVVDGEIVHQNMTTSNSVNQISATDQTDATSSRTTYQVVDSDIVHQNMTTSNSDSQDSATRQPSQAHGSPEVEEASSHVTMDTSAVKLPDSNRTSDSESAI